MVTSATGITDLASGLLLDDTSDALYRSLIFSEVSRLQNEDKSHIQAKLDKKLEIKLARQLNWSTALTSLDPSTHKFCRFYRHLSQNKLTTEKLEQILEDNYWLKIAIHQSQEALQEPVVSGNLLLLQLADSKFFHRVCYQYFVAQMKTPCREILSNICQLSTGFVNIAQVETSNPEAFQQLYRLAFLNILPALVLLKIFDRALQSLIQDELNTLPFECNSLREAVKSYQPCAETLMNFLIFDEFVKPHIFESVEADTGLISNLVVDETGLTELELAFLQYRQQVINNYLLTKNVLSNYQQDESIDKLGMGCDLTAGGALQQKYRAIFDKFKLAKS